MMGIPPEDERQIFEWTNTILGVGDPEYVSSMEDLMGAGFGLFQYGLQLAEERLSNPLDDITSTLMHAEVDGQRLTASELGSFFVLLVVAGNETTRTAVSHGLYELTRHPDQKQAWIDDIDAVSPTAVEEIVRWSTPVIHFRRTATADTELGGQQIREGDKVVMFYNSANRDREGLRRSIPLRSQARSERARRLRRRRSAFLPGRQSCSSRDPRDVRRTADPICPTSRHRASPRCCSPRSSTASSA